MDAHRRDLWSEWPAGLGPAVTSRARRALRRSVHDESILNALSRHSGDRRRVEGLAYMTAGRKSEAAPYVTRRERRASERAARSGQRSTARVAKRPIWRSPMLVFTLAAVLLGSGAVVYALANQPRGATDTLAAPIAEVPAGISDGRTLGTAGAPVTVEIWSDFQCPGCRQLATRVEPPIVTQLVVPGYARLVYHDAAFQGHRVSSSWDESEQSAAAARCAADQGRFWQMHDWLFANWNGENEGAFRPERLRLIADSAELDMAAYDRCMGAGDKQSAVTVETDAAVASGIQSTPTILLNGQPYTAPVTVKGLTDAIMSAAGGASPAPAAQGLIAP
jgi:protein-disulfide isomerase